MTTSATPRPGALAALPVAAALALALGAVGWAWAPTLSIPLSGEDYSILSRLARAEAGTPHVYRPLLDLVLSAVHGAAGVTTPWPFHAVALGLHVVNALLVFALALELFRSSRVAVLAALLFGLGVAATDALAWTAALNRPLSGFGALVALNGVARLRARPGLGACLAAAGLVWQFAANEEVYGTALLAAIWAGSTWLFPSRVGGEGRSRSVLVVFVLPLALVAIHYFVLDRVPGGTSGVLEKGLGQVGWSVTTRTQAVVAGFGLPGLSGTGALVVVLAALCIVLATTQRRAGLLVGLFWLVSFVPFALSDAVGYRFYPTQAPTALLFSGALFGLLRFASKRAAVEWGALGVAAVACFALTYGPREARLASWREALVEIEACREPLFELPQERESMPVWVNLEATTLGLVLYHYGVSLSDLRVIGFLDGRSGYCALDSEWPDGPWFGRRCEGSYGSMEPELYFANRPEIPTLRLYAHAVAVDTLEEARELLAQEGVDLTRTVLAEASAQLLGGLVGVATDAVDLVEPAEVVVLEPLSYDPVEMTGTMRVALRIERPMILVYQENFLYQPDFHVSADQALITHLREVRERRLVTRSVGTQEEYPTFYVNAFAWGTLLPPGEHDVRLDSYKVSSELLR